MKVINNTGKAWAIVVLSLVAATTIFTLNTTFVKANAAAQTNGFNVINAIWGTATSPESAAPGDIADTLTVTLQNIYSATAETVETYLELPTGFSVYNGSGVAYAATSGTYPTGATIQLSYTIDLASSLTLGTYIIPMEISWSAAGYAYYLNDTVQVTVQLDGRPQLLVAHASNAALSAGQVNEISFAVSNNGTGQASDISLTPSTQTGGVLNTISKIPTLAAGQSMAETALVYVPTSSAGNIFTLTISGSYEDPYGNSETTNQNLNIYVSAVSQPKLRVSSTLESIAAGQVDTIPINLTNTGTEAISQISTSLSIEPSTVTILGTFPYVPSLAASSTISEEVSIYVPLSLQSAAVSVTFTSSFVQGGSGASASQTLGFYTSSPATYNATLALVPMDDSVTTGQNSLVTFKLENIGSSIVDRPVVTLQVSSPLVVLSNSTFGYSNSILPGGSVAFESTVTSSPTATLGAYSGTLSVTYYDQNGNQHASSFAVGFILTGTITLTAESETVSQSTRTVSVSGSLLNEGTASAYYASIVACVVPLNTTGVFRTTTTTSTAGAVVSTTSTATFTRTFTSFNRSFSGFPGGAGFGLGGTTTTCPQTSTSSYVGEIDPNSPVAYTATAAYLPSNTTSAATLVLVITYENSFGTSTSQPIDKVISLAPAASGSSAPTPTESSPGHLLVKIVLYGVIAAVVVALIVGGMYASRKRRSDPGIDEKVV